MSSTVDEKPKEDTSSEKTKEIPALEIERGVENTMPFSTPFNPMGAGLRKNSDEQLQEVLREEWDVQRPSVRQLIIMRRLDGHARALYRLLTLPIRSALARATFVPAEDGKEEADFITKVFRTAPGNGGMTNTFQRFMGQLLGAMFEGFAAFEKVFWCPEDGPLAGKYTLKKLAFRPADTVTFIADKAGGFAGIRQRTVVAGRTIDAFIESEYAFYYAAQEDERKFYGVSFFESAFPHYDAKAKTYFTAHLAAQRAAVGTRVGTVPPNATKSAKEEFALNLSNLALAQWMMLPEGFKVEILREGGSFDFLNLINHHNHMMSESVLANFFDRDTGGGTGESGALVNFAAPGDDMFVLMLRAVMDDIANQINHYLIPQLIDYNFKGHKYPIFTWGSFTDEQQQAIANTFDKLATAGQSMNVTPEFMRELEKNCAREMGLEIDWKAVEKREAEEKAAQMAQFGMTSAAFPGDAGAAAAGALPESGSPSISDILNGVATGGGPGGQGPNEPPRGAAASSKALMEVQKPVVQSRIPKKVTSQVKLAGVTDDMFDWADRMVALSGEDWSDG